MRVVDLIRERLGVRLTLMFVAAAVVPVVIVGVLSFQRASDSLRNLAVAQVQQEATLTTQDLTTFLGQFSTDLLTMSNTPPVQAIIRARDNGGIDPAQNDPYEVWVNRLTQIFKANAQTKKFYQQVRYLNEDGDEMVRVDFRDGKIDIVSGTDRLQNKASASYFTSTRGLDTGEVSISALNLNKENGKVETPHVPVIRFSTPIIDPAGAFRGAVVSNVYADSFVSRLNVDSGEIYLANEDGAYILNPDSSKTFGTDVGGSFTIDDDFGATHGKLAASGSTAFSDVDSDIGQVVAMQTVAFDPRLPDRHWLLTRTIPESEVMAPINSLRTLLIALGAGIAAVAVVAALWMSRQITAPLAKMGEVASDLAERVLPGFVNVTQAVTSGDLTKTSDITVERIDIDSRDELGQMAGSFNEMGEQLEAGGNSLNEMVESLRTLVGQMGETANSLSTASNQLSDAAEQAGGATTGIASATQQLSSGAQEQVGSIDQTRNAMQELGSSITQISQGSEDQAAAIEQASAIVNQVSSAISEAASTAQGAAQGSEEASEAANAGVAMVDETIQGMERISTAVDAASQQIAQLGTQSEEIGKIVAVIDDIAAQTNLLALNAAIEAARAGEQGRGFAVVADEVRGLAERVTQATTEIATLIDSIQKGVNESISAVEEGTRQVAEGATQAEKTGDALRDILGAVSGVADQIGQISASAEQVNASSEEMVSTIEGVNSVTQQNTAAAQEMAGSSNGVTDSIEQISAISQQNSAASQEMSASAEEMSAQVEEVVASAQGLDSMAQELQQAVSVFKLSKNGQTSEIA